MMWNIWYSRNHVLYQNKQVLSKQVVDDSLDHVLEFIKRNLEIGLKKKKVQPEGWNHIPREVVLVQVDVGFSTERYVVFGCVFKNDARGVLLATRRKDFIEMDTTTAELLEIRWCLQLARSQNFDKIIVHSDVLKVDECINGHLSLVSLAHIADDCRELLKSFRVVSIMYFSRFFNFDAHIVVGLGELFGSRTWIGGFPFVDVLHASVVVVVVSS
ncbi:unnamed protein product [Vicia faba]|uniref:RNase H type-1 domain-containing protein n=1 Tax=Vicia faba TaxID=3906 RepID=A0AAV0YM86_VICFA|nr:unnamed protein product [Vicia faba]